MLVVEINPPVKSSRNYLFRYRSHGGAFQRSRFWRLLFGSEGRFGYETLNYSINHHEIWDTVYPLLYFTRGEASPLRTGHQQARIIFKYPYLTGIADFFIQRASRFGLRVQIEGNGYHKTFDTKTSGAAIAFGSGKESRLTLGVLREIGISPQLYTVMGSGTDEVADLEVFRSRAYGRALVNRVMPGLMSGSEFLFLGREMHINYIEDPWHSSYDFTPKPMAEFSNLLASFGVRTWIRSVVGVLPSHLLQMILCRRYPDLYRYQHSVRRDSVNPKNLTIPLCKLYYGIDFQNHCSLGHFKKMLKEYVDGEVYGRQSRYTKRGYKIYNNERKALIYRLREHEWLEEVRGTIPESWRGDWIDGVHAYKDTDLDPRILSIYSQYAPIIDDSAHPMALECAEGE